MRFLGAAANPAKSNITLLGAPLDLTTSFRPGTRFAPGRIRAVSEGLESYSLHWQQDLEELAWADEGDVLLSAEVMTALGQIETACREVYARTNRLLLLGGEHLITYGAVCAARSVHPDLAVLCWDAHADLRHEYLGLCYSHATVGRRILDLVGEESFFQAGVRSVAPEERGWIERLWGEDLQGFVSVMRKKLGTRPVYLSIDVDVLDPAYAPGTGAPEPGGVTTRELFSALYSLEGMNLVGADIVEVCPPCDGGDVTALVAAKLTRELLFMLDKS